MHYNNITVYSKLLATHVRRSLEERKLTPYVYTYAYYQSVNQIQHYALGMYSIAWQARHASRLSEVSMADIRDSNEELVLANSRMCAFHM